MGSGATIYVKHLDQMAAFYGACLGLAEVAAEAGDYRILESATLTLSIVQVRREIAATINLSDPPTRRDATPIKLAFDVPSIAAARSTITDHGGQVDDHEWEFRGFRHCDFVDPEGNVNQLRARSAPPPVT